MSGLRAWWAGRSPTAGAAVTATGIVTAGLRLIGAGAASLVAPVLTGAFWIVLGGAFVWRLVADPGRRAAEARGLGALTAPAATTVLGYRLSLPGLRTAATALPALATLLCAVLLPVVARHWHPRMPGAMFLCCVAIQGLTAPAAALAAAGRTAWLARGALVLFWPGLALYAFALPRFDVRQVLDGGRGSVGGGRGPRPIVARAGLLAAGEGGLYLWNDDDGATLRIMTVTLLAMTIAVYLMLPAAEVARPRPGYDQRRWTTVFPRG